MRAYLWLPQHEEDTTEREEVPAAGAVPPTLPPQHPSSPTPRQGAGGLARPVANLLFHTAPLHNPPRAKALSSPRPPPKQSFSPFPPLPTASGRVFGGKTAQLALLRPTSSSPFQPRRPARPSANPSRESPRSLLFVPSLLRGSITLPVAPRNRFIFAPPPDLGFYCLPPISVPFRTRFLLAC